MGHGYTVYFLPNRSTRHKVLLAVYGVLVLLGIGVVLVLHQVDRKGRYREAFSTIGTISQTAAGQVNAGHVGLLLDKYVEPGTIIKHTQDAWYYVMHDQLRRSVEMHEDLLPALLVATDPELGDLITVATSDKKPTWRATFIRDRSLIERLAKGGATRMQLDGIEQLVHSAPVVDLNGVTVAYVVTRMPEAPLDIAIRTALWRNMGITLFVLLLIGALLFRSVGGWLRADELAQEQLTHAHLGITDSIAYAGKIQRALVPGPAMYDALFEGAFIIDRPKHMVSGDFHWCQRISETERLVATADCTGHGLPGAMLAAIGCSLLNEVVANHPQKDPAELLGILNTRLTTTLHQQGVSRGAGDGMDIALCRIDLQAREILFAGAMRPLYWLHQGQLTVINGDRKPIGGSQHELDRSFTCHRLAFTPGDRIYLFSDGYVDQFGGPDRKRFMSQRLHQLLADHRDLSMPQQAELLERAFDAWKGTEEQVDDVCMLGLAV